MCAFIIILFIAACICISFFGEAGVPILILIIVGGFLILVVYGAKEKEKLDSEKEEKQKKLQEEKERKKEEKKLHDIELEQKYGTLTKRIGDYMVTGEISIYEQSNVVVFGERPVKFEDILDYELKDNSKVIRGNIKSTTKTSNSSILGRAVVGELIAGPAGAVIGGATAKKESVLKAGHDVTIHHYYLNVTINSVSEPLVTVDFKGREKTATEAASVINVIISRTREK